MAYKLMSEQLLTSAKTLFVATQPVWEWYADQVKRIKTPMDCLRETAATTGGRWMSGRELNSLAQIFTSRQALASAGLFDSERPIAAKRLFSLVVNVMRHRAWSHAVIRAVESCPALPNGSLGPDATCQFRHRLGGCCLVQCCLQCIGRWGQLSPGKARLEGPPEAYSELLLASTPAARKREIATTMKQHWGVLLKLEQRFRVHPSFSKDHAASFWEDQRNSACISPRCVAGRWMNCPIH